MRLPLLAGPPSTCPAVAPQLWSAAHTSPPWPTRTLPAHLPSCKDGGLSTPTARQRGPGEGQVFSAHPSHIYPHIHLGTSITPTLTPHTQPSIHSSIKYLLSTYYIRCLGLVLGTGDSSREQNRHISALMELTFSGDSTYIVTQTHTDTQLALTSLIPDSGLDPLPVPMNEWPLG